MAEAAPRGVDELLGFSEGQAAARESSLLARENQKLRARLAELERETEAQLDAFRAAAKKAEAAPCRECVARQDEVAAAREQTERALAEAKRAYDAMVAEKEDAVQTGGRLLAKAREAAEKERATEREAAESKLIEMTQQRDSLQSSMSSLRSELEEARRAVRGASAGKVDESELRAVEKRAAAAEERAAFLEAELGGCKSQMAIAVSELEASRRNSEMHLRRGDQLVEELAGARELLTKLQQGDRQSMQQAQAREQAAQYELATLRSAMETVKEEFERLKKAKAGVEAERAALQLQLKATEGDLAQAAAQVTVEHEAREAECADLQAELKRVGTLLARAKKEAISERERAEGRVRESDALRAALVNAERQSDEAREASEQAMGVVTELRKEVQRLQALLDEARKSRQPNAFGVYVALKREVAAATREVEVMRQANASGEQGRVGAAPIDTAAAATERAAHALGQALGETMPSSKVPSGAHGTLTERKSLSTRPSSSSGSTRLGDRRGISPSSSPRAGGIDQMGRQDSHRIRSDEAGTFASRASANPLFMGHQRRRTGPLSI